MRPKTAYSGDNYYYHCTVTCEYVVVHVDAVRYTKHSTTTVVVCCLYCTAMMGIPMPSETTKVAADALLF